MTSNSNDLKKALQENLKLRRELATEVAEAKGEKFAAVSTMWPECLARSATPCLGKSDQRPYRRLPGSST